MRRPVGTLARTWPWLILILAASLASGQEDPAFNPATGISELERLSVNLEDALGDEIIVGAMRVRAQELRAAGKACAEAYRPQMERLQNELAVLGEPDPNEEIDIWEQRRQISETLARASSYESNCELLEIRAGDFIALADKELARISSERMWSRRPSILMELGQTVEALRQLPDTAQINAVWESRFDVKPLSMLVVALLLAGLCIALGFRVRQQFADWVRANKLDQGPPTLRLLIPRPPAENAPILLAGLALTIYAYVSAREPSLQMYIIRIPVGLLLYGLGMVLIRWSTNKLSPAAGIQGLANNMPQFRIRMRACLIVLVVGFVALGPTWLGVPPPQALLLPYILLSLALIVSLMSILMLARQIQGMRRRFRVVRIITSVSLLVAAGAALIGYFNFSNYLLLAVLITLLAAFFLWMLLWMTGMFSEAVAKGGTRFSYKVRTWLGLSPTDPQSGLGFVNLVVDLTLWLSFVIIVVNAWDTSDKFPSYIADTFTKGFEVGSVSIVPMHIIYGMTAFAAIMIATGWVRQGVQKRYIRHTRMDRGARDALLKITGYIGFVVAALVGLKLTGISFAGLAIVAGALSVGIGFGLQNIVNNFVSGLILLFERPIKSGDFVTVGGVEGTVKTISIRSTEIETLDRQNVIVPNSELVSQQVTNWVLHDPVGRLTIDIGVAYGSDVEKVHDVLMDVANNCDYVVTDGVSAPKPKVLFMSFGDSSLDFELRIWIKQIRRRFDATSAIHFAVDAAFREHNIEIPFPQRDLHVRSWSETAPVPPPGAPASSDETPADRESPVPGEPAKTDRETGDAPEPQERDQGKPD
jgi:small-conductance mechanosensitive channel